MINWLFVCALFFNSCILSVQNETDSTELEKLKSYEQELSQAVRNDIQKNKYCDMISFFDAALQVDPFEQDAKNAYKELPIHARFDSTQFKESLKDYNKIYKQWKHYYCTQRSNHRTQGFFAVCAGLTAVLVGYYW